MIKRSHVVIEVEDTPTEFNEDGSVAQSGVTVQHGVVVQTITPLLELRRNTYVRKGHEWFTERYDQEPGEFSEEFREAIEKGELSFDLQERWDALRLAVDWATFMASATSVSRCENAGTGYGSIDYAQIPDEWNDPAVFFSQVDHDLFEMAVEEANRLNPGLWRLTDSEEEKKSVRVTVMK